MKRILSFFYCAFLLCFYGMAQDVDCAKGNVLWFDKPTSLDTRSSWYIYPDKVWQSESFPLGNGSIGANIFGSISAERITFNEKTLWTGGPKNVKNPSEYWDVNKNSAHVLPEIRQAFLDNDLKKAQDLIFNNMNGIAEYDAAKEYPNRFGAFTSAGEFFIETGHSEIGMTNYQRALSLDSSFVAVNYDKDGVRFHRRYFISYPDSVMVIRYTSSKPGTENLTFRFQPTPEMKMSASKTASDEIEYYGALVQNSLKYVIRVKAINDGGSVTVTDDGKIEIREANSVVFLIVADTGYRPNYNPDFSDPLTYYGCDPEATTEEMMRLAAEKTYSQLLANHEKDYKSIFDRVSIHLNPDVERPSAPTTERINAVSEGKSDFGMQEIFFQYGRYLAISSSRKGNMPSNLQGMWCNNLDGPWHVDYHNNINEQMNYWPVLTTSLDECFEPLMMLIKNLVEPGKHTAKAYYNARGWMTSIATNIYGFTSPFITTPVFHNTYPTSPWYAAMVYDYYDYTRNLQFLKDNYYIIKEEADFVCDYLWKRPDGTYTATPSQSPEHGPVDQGVTFVHAICREILMDAIDAANILKKDKSSIKEWRDVLDHIYPYKIGRYGQLQEWYDDIDSPDEHHHHENHLYGMYPGHSISVDKTPELADGVKVALIHRGEGPGGWSWAWKSILWSNLYDGNQAYDFYEKLSTHRKSGNFWDNTIFQVDELFGATAAVSEMLLQSHVGYVHLLPALPDAWKDGSITGLKARGNFTIDMAWKDGQLQKAVIVSNAGTPCEVHYKDQVLKFKTRKGQSYDLVFDGGKLIKS